MRKTWGGVELELFDSKWFIFDTSGASPGSDNTKEIFSIMPVSGLLAAAGDPYRRDYTRICVEFNPR